MIALGIILVLVVWFAIAYGVSVFVYRYGVCGSRWIQIAVLLTLLWLPYWDLIPGLIVYREAVREWGGLHIYRTVRADGYLSGVCSDCEHAWMYMRNSEYRYHEIQVVEPAPPYLLAPKPGYYEVRVYPLTHEQCTAIQLPQDTTRRIADGEWGVTGVCAVAKRRDRPISRYMYETSKSGGDPYPAPTWLGQKVKVSWQKVTDLKTGELIAKAGNVSLQTWIGPWMPFSYRRFSSSRGERPYDFNISEVIQPLSVNEGSRSE